MIFDGFAMQVFGVRICIPHFLEGTRNAIYLQRRGFAMNAYLIAAKANAWELDQQVGRALEANLPDHKIESIGRGVAFYPEDREKMMHHQGILASLFGLN